MQRATIVWLVLTTVVIFTGCFRSTTTRLDFKEPTATVAPSVGYLKVYTASYAEKEWPDEPEIRVFSGYNIYLPDGTLLRKVGEAYNTPEKIKLAPGNYVVVAKLDNDEATSLNVIIEPGKMTEVNFHRTPGENISQR